MNDTLDRLKALGNKLEVKLSKKDIKAPIETKEIPKEVKESTRKPTEHEIDTSAEYATLAKKIIGHMSISEGQEPTRAKNVYRVAELYKKLTIYEKAPDFNNIFIYKAMNISGIGLKEEDFGEIREGKYTQIIAITYEPDKNGKKKAKNISLCYFGKAEKLEDGLKNDIIEFVLRWRYEKAFQNLEHYRELLGRIKPVDQLF